MPRPTLPAPLKNLRCFGVLLTQTEEHDITEFYELNYRKYYEMGESVLRHLEEDTSYFENGSAYARASWRMGIPEHKDTGVREDDIEAFGDFMSFYNDVVVVKSCFPEFSMDMTEYSFLRDKIRAEMSLMKEAEEFSYSRAYRQWCSRNKEFVEEQKKREKHRSHKPKAYYIALCESDPLALEWYGGKIPDYEDTCEYCIREKAIRDAAKVVESAPAQEEVARVEVPVIQKEPEIIPYRHHCEMCDYHCYHKVELAAHLRTREHKKAEKEFAKTSLFCDCCNLQCRTQVEFDNHIATQKHQKKQEGFSGFHCEKCDYKTNRRCNFDRHIQSKKHLEENNDTRASSSGDDM